MNLHGKCVANLCGKATANCGKLNSAITLQIQRLGLILSDDEYWEH